MKNKVSIIVPCYNQELYIKETLQSIKNQTYTNWECIIVNDGSTDKSIEIVKKYIEEDLRFQILTIPNGGLSNARNQGIKSASGEYILPLDGDDKIHPDYLKLAIDVFKNDSNVDLVYCNAELFGYETGFWQLPDYTYDYMFQGNCIFCSAIYRKEDYYTKTKGYDINLIYGYEDWEFWLQLLNENSKVVKLENVLFYYRRHKVSMSKTILLEDRSKWTYNYVYKKHFRKLMNVVGKIIEDNFPEDHKAKFLNDIKGANYDIGLLLDESKKIKKTVSYKLMVRLELEIRKFFKKNKKQVIPN